MEGNIKKIDIKKNYFQAVLGSIKLSEVKIPHSFDFDADRLIIKTKNGKETRGDIIGGIIADTIAKKGDTIIYDLRCTKAIPEHFRNEGIKCIPSRVGGFNIKKLMREKKAVFGIEISGHYYFKQFHYCEAPLFGLKKLREAMDVNKKTLEELAEPFMKYNHTGEINFKTKNSQKIIETLKNIYKTGSQNSLDGLTVEFSNWWFNIRPSHTEPLARLVIEANSPKIMKEKKKEIISLIS